jgi:hypothetical protein
VAPERRPRRYIHALNRRWLTPLYDPLMRLTMRESVFKPALVLHHLTRVDKQQTMREVVRVLRPGGGLHVVDFGPPRSSTLTSP